MAAADAGFDDFLAAPRPEQDRILTDLSEVRDLLFGLTIDALYSVPEPSVSTLVACTALIASFHRPRRR